MSKMSGQGWTGIARLVKLAGLTGLIFWGTANSARAFLVTNPADRIQRSVSAGLNYTDGNTRGVLSFLRANLKSETDHYLYRLNTRFQYGKTELENERGREEMELTSQQFDLNGEVRRLFAAQDYLQFKSSFQHNRITELDYRIELGPSVGRYFVRTVNREGSLDIGVAQLREEQSGEETENRPAWRLGARWEQILASGATFFLTAELLPSLVDPQDALFNGEMAVETALSDKLKIRVQLTEEYNSRPADKVVRHDVALATLLTVKF